MNRPMSTGRRLMLAFFLVGVPLLVVGLLGNPFHVLHLSPLVDSIVGFCGIAVLTGTGLLASIYAGDGKYSA